jgi:hypothetical protein
MNITCPGGQPPSSLKIDCFSIMNTFDICLYAMEVRDISTFIAVYEMDRNKSFFLVLFPLNGMKNNLFTFH